MNRIWLAFIVIMLMPSLVFAEPEKRVKRQPEWCQIQGFACLQVQKRQSWQSLFPDDRERAIMMRINKTNAELYTGKWLKVPLNLEATNFLEYSPLPQRIETDNEKVVVFDPTVNAWAAYDANGELVQWGPATGGKNWCNDIDEPCRTKSGTFRIYSLGSSNCKSSKFPLPDGGAPMPYCMFFNGGQAFHGSPGAVVAANESHGCVRLFVSDAEWLRYDFVEPPGEMNSYRGTKVVILPYRDAYGNDEEETASS